MFIVYPVVALDDERIIKYFWKSFWKSLLLTSFSARFTKDATLV